MSTPSNLFRRLGLLGVVYAALFFVANVLLGSEPSAKSTGAAVVKYYAAHKSSVTAGVFVAAFAAIAFMFFIASLHQRLARTDDGRHFSLIVTAGAAVYVTGILIMAALAVALVDAGHYGMDTSAQTLNVLSSDAWVPVVAGLSITALGTGVCALRTAALPAWLAWISVGLGVLSVAGPLGGIAFLLAPVWAIVVAVVLFRAAPADNSVEAPGYSPSVPAGR